MRRWQRSAGSLPRDHSGGSGGRDGKEGERQSDGLAVSVQLLNNGLPWYVSSRLAAPLPLLLTERIRNRHKGCRSCDRTLSQADGGWEAANRRPDGGDGLSVLAEICGAVDGISRQISCKKGRCCEQTVPVTMRC